MHNNIKTSFSLKSNTVSMSSVLCPNSSSLPVLGGGGTPPPAASPSNVKIKAEPVSPPRAPDHMHRGPQQQSAPQPAHLSGVIDGRLEQSLTLEPSFDYSVSTGTISVRSCLWPRVSPCTDFIKYARG